MPGSPSFWAKAFIRSQNCAAAAAGRRNGADLGAVLLQDLGEEAEAAAGEMLADARHLDRHAQVGLVGAVPEGSVA